MSIIMIFLIAVVILVVSLIVILKTVGGGAGFSNNAANLVSSDELKQAIKENPSLQLVDVRTAGEFKSGKIRPAKNYDFFSKNFSKQCTTSLSKDKPVYLYCRSGARSAKAARVLAQEGFTEVYDLRGGYLAWK